MCFVETSCIQASEAGVTVDWEIFDVEIFSYGHQSNKN